jgi:hypothetical protein
METVRQTDLGVMFGLRLQLRDPMLMLRLAVIARSIMIHDGFLVAVAMKVEAVNLNFAVVRWKASRTVTLFLHTELPVNGCYPSRCYRFSFDYMSISMAISMLCGLGTGIQ